ncbi:MAG: M3 family metallopeptidase [candidate division Zixibacteria bacterium]
MRTLFLATIIFWAAEAYPYGAKPEHIAADSAWLLSLQDNYERIDSVFATASWDFYTTGVWPDIPHKYYQKNSELILSRYSMKKYGRIQGEFGSPELNRVARQMYIRLHKGRNAYLPDFSGLGPSLSRTLINYRPTFDGSLRSKNYLNGILRDEPDREKRKQAWYAQNEVGSKIAPGLRELIWERNRIAHEISHRDYYDLQLLSMGMKVEDLFDILALLDSISLDPYKQILQKAKFKLESDRIEPWDFLYAYGSDSGGFYPRDSLTLLLNRTMNGLGFEMDNLGISYDLKPRPGKFQHGVCFPVSVPDDIRVLASIGNDWRSYKTVFHEVGHALHFSHIDQRHYILRSSPSGCFSEAMAEINEIFLEQPKWLADYGEVPEPRIRAMIVEIKEARIISLRYALARAYFERELYRTDAENPAELYWDIMSKFTLCSPHYDSDSWAAIPHYTQNPVYMHNYIIAELIAAQTLDYLKRTNGLIIDNKATAEFLIDNYYKPGASKDWFELVEDATGEPLNTKYYIEYILGR